MKRLERASLSALLVACLTISLAAGFLWVHLTTPFDGMSLQPGTQVWQPSGVVVTPLGEQADGSTPPAAASEPTRSPVAPVFPDLTEREREVLGLIAQAQTNSAIAEQLVLSLKTIRNDITEIFSKLQVADRAQAIVRARNAGLVSHGQ